MYCRLLQTRPIVSSFFILPVHRYARHTINKYIIFFIKLNEKKNTIKTTIEMECAQECTYWHKYTQFEDETYMNLTGIEKKL